MAFQQQHCSHLHFGHSEVDLLSLHSAGEHPQSAHLISMNWALTIWIKNVSGNYGNDNSLKMNSLLADFGIQSCALPHNNYRAQNTRILFDMRFNA